MKRSRELVSFTRREVCGGIAVCFGAILITGCGDDSGGMPPTDAAQDSSVGGSCGTATDAGAPATFMLGKPVYFAAKNFFVVRDSGGLYALTARCTHQGVTVNARTSDFFCPGHGATFNFNGDVTQGPANMPLQHFAMCMLPNGNVGVDTSMPVAKTVRLVA